MTHEVGLVRLTQAHLPILAVSLLSPSGAPTAQAQVAPSAAPAAREESAARQADQARRRRRRRVDPFAGQPRICALLITGGCCHDYAAETKVLMDILATEAPVDWTVVLEVEGGSNRTRTKVGLYNQPNWAAGYGLQRPIRMHGAMDHERRQHNIKVQVKASDHPVMKGFPKDWVTPMDELYVIDKLWPNAKALAAAVSPEDGAEYPMIWVNDYHGARVFGTTVGHGPETWDDPTFRDLLVRGFKWSVNRQ